MSNASRLVSIFGTVTTMNTPNTARTPVTIAAWAAATTFAPTMFSAHMTTSRAVMKTLSHPDQALSPTKSETA